MSFTRTLGGLALVAAVLVGCESAQPTGPIVQNPGTVEQQLRQIQLQNAQQNPGTQNPVATGVNPGATGTTPGGIQRSATGGRGNVSAGAPAAVNPGTTNITRQPGVGAPTR
jgi:hypothetical protein